ncbi:phage shock protein B [Isachenkonia alkalipeptolytica]|uniref:Phage shock protein B n=1 Tax=Isachenkonia alkalipeptolytica TaxID=2565777 RepID=A0AA43XID9_9CLOT|nr:phage shock protein B [Isachenkonia alkalipeptolytica]NBG87415.1 phage shock protein B [Isachenkonia alkalipeptolytica]
MPTSTFQFLSILLVLFMLITPVIVVYLVLNYFGKKKGIKNDSVEEEYLINKVLELEERIQYLEELQTPKSFEETFEEYES